MATANDPEALIVSLRAAHARSGLTQTEAAARAGISQPHLSAILGGKKDLAGSTLAALMRVYGLRLTQHGRGARDRTQEAERLNP